MQGHSPSNVELTGVTGVGGIPMPGGHFHQRNQSQDVGSLSSANKPIKNKISTRKRNAVGSYVASNVPNDNSDAGEFVIEDNQQYRLHHNKNVIM